MDLDLAWLRSWIDVVDSGGFARAAVRRHVSQPRISAHVASLEKTLGCMLIERRVRPLTLTDEGIRLLPQARAIVDSIDGLVADYRSTTADIAGRVIVTSFASANSEFLPGVLRQLGKTNPQIEVSVLDGDVHSIEAALADRRATVAIRPYRPEPTDRQLAVRPLWREPFVLLAPVGHPALDSEVVLLEGLGNERIITLGDPVASYSVGYEVWSAMQASHARLLGGMVTHQPTTMAAMVRAGHGIGVLNLLASAMIRMDGLEVRKIENHNLYRDVGVWWHSDRPLSRAARVFLQVVLAAPRPTGTVAVPKED